jgi:ribonuclease P protein component
VAVVAGRKVGGAVQRNRAKRRLRAALAGGTLPPELDVVVVARSGVLTADFTSLQTELAGLVRRAASRIPIAS